MTTMRSFAARCFAKQVSGALTRLHAVPVVLSALHWRPSGGAGVIIVSSTYRCHDVSTTTTASDEETGESVYQDYLDLTRQLEEIRTNKERQKSEALYEAWQRTEEVEDDETASKKKSKRAGGVAVVKTLVKETRKELWNAQKPEQQLRDAAQQAVQRAADDFAHPAALVQVGNQQLQAATTTTTASSSSSSSSEATTSGNEQQKQQQLTHLQTALDYYARGGSQGAAEGWFNHGHLLWTGFPPQEDHDDDDGRPTANDTVIVLPPNREEALESFKKAVALGDADAMYFLGVHWLSVVDEYDDDNTEPTDTQRQEAHQGWQLIQDAGAAGHGGALYYTALLHLNGHAVLGIPPCSHTDFGRFLDQAVEAGHADALFLRGHSYYHGSHGYVQDYRRALSDFLQAADAGHADAAVSAGAMLHTGDHVPRNQRQAFELYQHAGELGNREAWRNVAACYATGQGVAQSLDMARHITTTMRLNEED